MTDEMPKSRLGGRQGGDVDPGPPTVPADRDCMLLALAPDAITIAPQKWRRAIRPDRIEELARSVAEFGVIQPILVRQRADGAYELLAGEHRLRAALMAGLPEIPALVLDVDDTDAELVGLEENLRRYQPDQEWMVGLARWTELHELKHGESQAGRRKRTTAPRQNPVREAAERFGLSERAVEQAVAKAMKLAPPAREAWGQKRVTDQQADDLAALPHDEQVKSLPAVVEKTLNEAIALIAAEKEANPAWARRLARLLHEARPLAERLNNKLLNARAIVKKHEVAGLGGIGMLRIGFELVVVAESIDLLAKALREKEPTP